MTKVPDTNQPQSGIQNEREQVVVVTRAFLFYRVWVGIGFLAMVILSIVGTNTADGIGLALVATAVLLLTPEIGERLSTHGLWDWLQSRRWQRGMVCLGATGVLTAAVGIVFGSLIVSLFGVVAIEAAAFGLIPILVDKTFEPVVETIQEDTKICESLERFEARKGSALIGALMFIVGSLVQFMATVR